MPLNMSALHHVRLTIVYSKFDNYSKNLLLRTYILLNQPGIGSYVFDIYQKIRVLGSYKLEVKVCVECSTVLLIMISVMIYLIPISI